MKTPNQKNVLLLLCFVFLFLSCSNDQNPEIEENNYLTGKPHYFIRNGDFYFKYEWDELNRVSAFLEYESPGGNNSQYYFDNDYQTANIYLTYDDSDRIIFSSSAGNCHVHTIRSYYHYSDNRLDSIISDQHNWDFYWFYLNYENGDNCGPSQTQYFKTITNDPRIELQRKEWVFQDGCDKFNYQEKNYNIETDSLESIAEFQYKFTYDSEENEWPIRHIKCNFNTLAYTHPAMRNILSFDKYSLNGDFLENIYRSDFEYFSNGRLKSEIRTDQEGLMDTFQFYYR